MKGRSQRLQTANQPDDWVDGSWTVDCICGVNFDDGEEMVKCDECGVWVHTRCSRYVKEEELFTCDKCKNKNNRTNIEETEVAQFLVELPTKNVRIESNNSFSVPAKKPPLRIWTENPLEEKVHVQGIPGGDPGLFTGLPSVFSQQLWKCTGYVPKKFNFQYKEFPCWDSDKKEFPNVEEEDNENAADKGAGVLFSLSKESVRASPATTMMRTRTKVDDVSNDRKARSKDAKKSDLGAGDVRRSQNGARKEKILHRPFLVYSGKRKKEECIASKDLCGKKKARIIDKELDAKKRTAHASRAVFAPTSDAKQLEFYEERGAKSFKTDIQSVKNRNSRDTVAVEPITDCRVAVSKADEMSKSEAAAKLCVPEGPSAELTGLDQDVLAQDKISHVVLGANGSTEEIASGVACNGALAVCESKKGASYTGDDSTDGSSCKVLNGLEKIKTDQSPEIKDVQTSAEMIMEKLLASQNPDLKTEIHNDSGGQLNGICASLPDTISLKMADTAKSAGVVVEDKSGSFKGADSLVSSLPCGDRPLTVIAGESSESKVQNDVDVSVKEEPNGPKHASGDDEFSKSSVTVSSAVPSSKLKVAVSLGKSSSAGSSIVIPKSSSSNKSKPSGARNGLPVGNPVASDCRDHASDPTADEGKQDAMRKTEKERSSRIFHTSAAKRNASDTKDSAVSSSSKSSPAQNISASLASTDSTRALQSQNPLPAASKAMASGLSQKVAKSNHTAFHPSLKGGHLAAAHQPVASNPPPGLSDEELALLLHQELNSSPRVPRVPRVRQASLPQLASQAASTGHIKRTSSSGMKDQNLIPKRKVKETSKDGAAGPREVEDEVRMTSKATSSSDKKRLVRHSSGDACVKEAKGSPAHGHSFKKNASSLSTSANSGPSSSNEANYNKRPSRLASPMSNSDDDFTTDQPVYRTLPGLINEIMSKGRRMTYEELCDAVLPHWPSLRKHNGERYAYSSHSQAVLDCLRNRHEWAQLVDRGPKTNSSRKRRRPDAQDFEEDEEPKQRLRDRESKRLESQRDDFPKGKRNARKRRRLALQGRHIKDLRKADILTDEDDGAFSNSTKDSMFSEEDEIQGGGGGDDASSGSEDDGRHSKFR